MPDFKDQDRIDDLRRRLYARGNQIKKRSAFDISATKVEAAVEEAPVSETWAEPPVVAPAEPEVVETVPQEVATEAVVDEEAIRMARKKKRRSYRIKIVLGAIGLFVLAVGVSSLFLLGGNNRISGENIAISVSGPFTVGGGQELPLQIGVTNANAVPINAATLIIEYPLGTQSTSEAGKELFIERLPLDTIASGETLNIPLKAIVFGEENAEKMVNASIEYRVEGSNATFFKEAEPLRFKISFSPVVLRVDAIKKISSGQETTMEITLTSNSPTPVTDILVKADYPTGFDYVSSDPDPVAGNGTWSITELAPSESATISVTGIVTGTETDEFATNFSVGVPNEREPFVLASVFTTGTTQFEIEQPFIDVELSIDSSGSNAIIETGQPVTVAIDLENSLSNTVYDAVVTTELSGNALSSLDISVNEGFYDSNTNTIIWDVSQVPDLEQLLPGDKERFTFSLAPAPDAARTPQIDFKVDVKARRVSERNVPEELLGTASGVAKVASEPKLLADSRFNVGGFTGSGPVPPRSGQSTTYTISLLVENGTNKLSNGEVTATVPTYVTFLDNPTGDGTVLYNSTSRVLTWRPGDVAANDTALTSFQVSILPSVSQIGTTPTLLGEQRLRGTDDFTGATVRATRAAVTTELPEEAGYEQGNGRVTQ